MKLEADINTVSCQNIFNVLQLHILVSFFIDTAIYLIEDNLDFFL